MHRLSDRLSDRQTDCQTDRPIDRQTDCQTDSKTGRPCEELHWTVNMNSINQEKVFVCLRRIRASEGRCVRTLIMTPHVRSVRLGLCESKDKHRILARASEKVSNIVIRLN